MKIRQWLLVMLFSSSAVMANTDNSESNAEAFKPNPIMAMSMAMDIEQNRAKLRFNRLQLLEQKMQLKGEQDAAFWEIYCDYVIAMEKVNDRVWNLIVQYAEAYHQDYATIHPNQPYIVYNDLPKIRSMKEMFPDFWREKF